MTWNYRIMKRFDPQGGVYYAMHEVFYDKDGGIKTWAVEEVHLWGEKIDDIKFIADKVAEAASKPVIYYNDGTEIT